MKISEIKYEDVANKTFVCLPAIEDLESVLDTNMQGKIVYVRSHHDGVYSIGFDTNSFEEINDFYAKNNYYDMSGVPRLTAKEAGHWPKNGIVTLYVMGYDELEKYFKEV